MLVFLFFYFFYLGQTTNPLTGWTVLFRSSLLKTKTWATCWLHYLGPFFKLRSVKPTPLAWNWSVAFQSWNWWKPLADPSNQKHTRPCGEQHVSPRALTHIIVEIIVEKVRLVNMHTHSTEVEKTTTTLTWSHCQEGKLLHYPGLCHKYGPTRAYTGFVKK